MLDFFVHRPYRSFFLMLLLTFAPFAFNPLRIQPWTAGDFSVYINVAQTLLNGGILYKDAIDTKNMGFFLLFYSLYAFYARFFADMAYFFLFQAFLLFFWYWLLTCLFYKILAMVYKPLQAWVGTALFIAGLMPLGFMSFLSQPEMALMIHFLYIYTVLRFRTNKGFLKYILFGAVLGIAFALSSPYIFLTLSIPLLIPFELGRRMSLGSFTLRAGAAFGGFLLALTPFFLSFAFNDALSDWQYWNFVFPQTTYAQMHTGKLNVFQKIGAAFFNMLFKSTLKLSLDNFDHLFFALLMYSTFILWAKKLWSKVFFKQSLRMSWEEKILFLCAAPALLARLSLLRYYFHYNYYLIPFLFLLLFILLREIQGRRARLILGSFLGLFYAAALYTKIVSPPSNPLYPEQLKAFMAAEDKNPAYIAVNYPPIYSYNLRWRSVFYTMYDYQDPGILIEKIQNLRPELVLLMEPENDFSFRTVQKFQKIMSERYDLALETPYDMGRAEIYRLKENFRVKPL